MEVGGVEEYLKIGGVEGLLEVVGVEELLEVGEVEGQSKTRGWRGNGIVGGRRAVRVPIYACTNFLYRPRKPSVGFCYELRLD